VKNIKDKLTDVVVVGYASQEAEIKAIKDKDLKLDERNLQI
jgi:hypothetical protein